MDITNEMIELIKDFPKGVRKGPCFSCGVETYTAQLAPGVYQCRPCMEEPYQKLLAIESRLMSKGWAS
jgi:hypothetical protein